MSLSCLQNKTIKTKKLSTFVESCMFGIKFLCFLSKNELILSLVSSCQFYYCLLFLASYFATCIYCSIISISIISCFQFCKTDSYYIVFRQRYIYSCFFGRCLCFRATTIFTNVWFFGNCMKYEFYRNYYNSVSLRSQKSL